MNIDASKPMGLIAGGGLLPYLICKTITGEGRNCIVAGFENTEERTTELASEHQGFSLGDLGSILQYFRSHGVSQVALAGQINHTEIFRDRQFDELMHEAIDHPDNRAESVLRRIADIIERELAPVASIIEILSRNVVEAGTLHEAEITKRQQDDLDFGWDIGCKLARYNIGQTIMVRSGVVVAVEAIEGTDAMIRRMKQYQISEGTVIKVPMINKDPRFDVPIIGPSTIESMLYGGATALLVAAFETIIIERDAVLSACRDHGVSLLAREFSLE